MSEKLLPCPFCGGEATIDNAGGKYQAWCKHCCCIHMGEFYNTEAEAIAAWNRRAQPENELRECHAMTNLITEARELCEKATPGPWEVVGKDAWGIEGFPQVEMNTPDGKYFPVHNDTDAAFIARSRTLIPELCDALEASQEQNKQLMHEARKLASESVERDVALAMLEAGVEGWAKAEQDGRVAVLPCKVGDTVYNLTSDSPSGIEETKVFQIRLTKNSYRALCNCVYDDWGSARWEFGPNDFGKTVFLTRTEAADALEKKEGKENDG